MKQSIKVCVWWNKLVSVWRDLLTEIRCSMYLMRLFIKQYCLSVRLHPFPSLFLKLKLCFLVNMSLNTANIVSLRSGTWLTCVLHCPCELTPVHSRLPTHWDRSGRTECAVGNVGPTPGHCPGSRLPWPPARSSHATPAVLTWQQRKRSGTKRNFRKTETYFWSIIKGDIIFRMR